MHVDANFVVSKRHERTLDDPEVLQTESFDLCDEIGLLLKRTHLGLHAAAADRLTLRRGSRAKNPPSVDATFHEGKLAAAAVASLFVNRESTALGQFAQRTLRAPFHQKSIKARILSGKYFRLTYTIYSVGPCTG